MSAPGGPNPFVGNQGQIAPKIPFEPFERKILGNAARWMRFAGIGNLIVGGLTLAMVVAVDFSLVAILRGLAFVAVGVLTMLPSQALARLEGQTKDDLADLDLAFTRIKVLFATKAAAAGIMIALALTLWRLRIQYDLGH